MSVDEREAGRHMDDAEAAAVIYAPGCNPGLETRVWSHIATCAECTMRLEALRAADRSAGQLLGSLDLPAPGVSAPAIVRAAQRPQRRLLIPPHRRAAAAIIAFMVVATGAVAAIPGSPLHRFIMRAISVGELATQRVGSTESQGAPAASRGVSFAPSSSLDVVFEPRGAGGVGGGGVVHVRIVDGDQVSLSSTDADATYRVGSNRITVNQSVGNFQLEIPRSLPELRILIGSSVVFDRRLGQPGATDSLTIPLSRPHAKAPSP